MTILFDQLVSALTRAVVDAQHQIQQTHIGELSRFFDKDGSPIPVALKIPRLIPATGPQGIIAKYQVEEVGLVWEDVVDILTTKHDWGKVISLTEIRLVVNSDEEKINMLKVLGDKFAKMLPILQQALQEPEKAVTVNVPLITLVNPGQLSIQEMQITLQVDMSEITKAASKEKTRATHYEWKPPEVKTFIAASTTTGKKPGDVGLAQVTLRVTAEETPEGLARLLDHLNKCL